MGNRSSVQSAPDDWPWVWAIRDVEVLDWKRNLSNEDILRTSKAQALPVEIMDGLYLGSAKEASDFAMLESFGITHVLNVADDVPNYHEGVPGLTYKQVCALHLLLLPNPVLKLSSHLLQLLAQCGLLGELSFGRLLSSGALGLVASHLLPHLVELLLQLHKPLLLMVPLLLPYLLLVAHQVYQLTQLLQLSRKLLAARAFL